MSLSRHEQNLAAATLLVALFGILGLKLRPGLEAWRERIARLESLRRERTAARELIEMGPQWREHYDEVRNQMPVFGNGVQVDTYWMSIMDRLADEYSVSITRRNVGREARVGDVYEFTTDCQWEGPLDAVAKFLCALQDAGAMLDVRDLVLRTHGNRKGFLRGSFTLYCAYMRGETGESSEPMTPEPPKAEAPPAPVNEPADSSALPPSPAPVRQPADSSAPPPPPAPENGPADSPAPPAF